MLTWPAPQIPRLPGQGGPVSVRDTSTGQLVVAAPGPTATLYVCGITPYDATHLGHAATYVAFDVLGRAWRDAGQQVRYASNVTDVDDPLLERATATGVEWQDLAAEQVALYAEDMTALGVVPPDAWTGVVESVPAVVDAVAALVAAGAAYTVDTPDALGDGPGDVYADLSADGAFGTVAGLDPATMLALSAERGGDPGRPGKRSPLDPLLWRRERAGEPAWDGGTLGRGRPGWHIECAVIARDSLGLPFDVEGGGSDLQFPHHEMSTSHARLLDAGHGARVHVHAGMVGLDGEKMSKSRGNLVLVSRLREDGVDPMAIRLAILAHRYSEDWDWTDAGLKEAVERLGGWRRALSGNGGPDATATIAALRAAVADDLDTPRALDVVDDWALAALRGDAEPVEGAPGLVARAVDALLGVRL
ncbi:cysteine--1-D-myo-inosityl 2-amino-2-deoxy-alpha-D-glucopyranoside ligase [Cellulomonas fimi]|uniref:L-cysteine:1D-myo-inositol 2-amino-2-deoxy-alpha-D-glucopyranoside ligase n=1 Tax=Cellulomonas fimi (strain ATCC 484 / DSM 20113 / JCM 1341 / CCUG 24087 / LMG 16345 / NBRC 15513 / NCIMB 8980 / NCTC 7547 / NRS-133) TaxID=590998 RepID=F4GYC2_CELFA|nr:cysteine--1-D-myo-inosityl 2-amino-2-deoxy-alpha-D-glucopyranoside ligase [Cellulomonas fimi]AEE45911.1 cysteine/1-D-myo-inosityl 2-amino-2-deoxy-alpha-D-glucopyranoside ligase [Cellulomonas fimi ATCC 484]NNH06762.1 cysteine--1-D-myo-inosityl 2-amino-2-deoxy-alpha-D-glucopyranoside ligase [Cellulomonas fimi]VEH30973.1 L-cysteine:1D-myo-inositol 2-amino-2-deoxy-alpha-D-glucopyranoside ligase [Cellulomonas fimi]